MRSILPMAAAAMVWTSTAASAQATSQAFECALPYRAAVEAAATLTVTKQRSDPAELGRGTILEFDQGSTRIFGHAPKSLSFEVVEPAPNDRERIVKAWLTATFAPDPAISRAIISSTKWHFGTCVVGLHYCSRAADPQYAGRLEFFQEAHEFRLLCSYEMREADLAL